MKQPCFAGLFFCALNSLKDCVMKLDEIPQDGLDYKGRDKVKKLMYALDKDGKYTGANSIGWEAENTALRDAWADVEETLQTILNEVMEGRLSPVAWFMHKNLMDVPLLAKYMGKWQWTIKRHMKPQVFKKLGRDTLVRYAQVFNITQEELVNFSSSDEKG